MLNGNELIKESLTGNSAIAKYTEREQYLIALGMIVGIVGAVGELTKHMNSKKAPPVVLQWVEKMLVLPYPGHFETTIPPA